MPVFHQVYFSHIEIQIVVSPEAGQVSVDCQAEKLDVRQAEEYIFQTVG